MPRSVRYLESDRYYMLTNRTVLGMYLFAPDDECRRIIKGCLARAADEHDVELVCFVFMANHFHLIARFPHLNMGEFMEQFQSQLASRINDHRDREGTVFPTRYDDQALLDQQVLLDKIKYVLNNPVKDRQVRCAEDWPGVTSIDCHKKEGNRFEGQWLNHKRWRRYKRRKTGDKGRADAMETHTLDLHLPDALDGETDEERRQNLLASIKADRHRIWADATGDHNRPPRVAGAKSIEENLYWGDRPDEHPANRLTDRRWLGVASNPEKMSDYKDKRDEIDDRYRRALSAWRQGKAKPFPHGTYPPGWRHCEGSPLRM